jgi:hypothetical protein
VPPAVSSLTGAKADSYNKIVIPRGCDFFDFYGFDTPNQKIFQNSHKAVILSEAPLRSIA